MDRFMEKIYEQKEEQRYVGQMPRVRIRKISSVKKRVKSLSKTPLGIHSHGFGDKNFLNAMKHSPYDESVLNLRGSNHINVAQLRQS